MAKNSFKRILMVFVFLVGAILCLPTISHASQTDLEIKIEQIIGTTLDEYLATIDVKQAVDEVVQETLNTFIDGLSAEILGKYIQGEQFEIGAGLSYTAEDLEKYINGEYVEANDEEYSTAEPGEISNVINRYLQEIKEKRDSDVINYTHQYSEGTIKDNVINIIMSQVNTRLDTFGSYTRYRHKTDDGWYYGPWTYVKGNMNYRQKELIKETINNKLDTMINIGYTLSNQVLEDADMYADLTQRVQKYIIDRINNYESMQSLLDKIRTQTKITVNDELKDIIVESIESYLASDSGKAVFTGIKDAIYQYIDENGGLEDIKKNGFGEDTADYIGDRIGEIVKNSIRYSLAPYITELADGRVKEVTQEITAQYVNNGVWDLVVEAVDVEIAYLFSTAYGETITNNLVNDLDTYIGEDRFVTMLNEAFETTPVKNYVKDYYYTDKDGDQRIREVYLTYPTVGEYIMYVSRNATKNYIKNTLYPKLSSDVKASIHEYLVNSDKGREIKATLVERINQIFLDNVVEPLLDAINISVAEWVSAGLGHNIITQIKDIVSEYVEEFETADEVADALGIRLGVVLKEVRYNGDTYSGKKISLETLIQDQTLVSAERGAVIVPEFDSHDPLNDATVEIGTIVKYRKKVEELSGGSMVLVNPYITALAAVWSGCPNLYGAIIPLPWGPGVGIATISRTIGKYSTENIKTLEPEEAYVLAHVKNTNYYPDRVQQAYWQTLEYVHGLKFEHDEGPIDQDTYLMLMRIMSFASIALSVDWNNMFDNIANATTWGNMLSAIDTSLLVLALNACGVTMHGIFPFLDPEVVGIAGLFGFNLNNVAGFLQTGVAATIDWTASALGIQMKHYLSIPRGAVMDGTHDQIPDPETVNTEEVVARSGWTDIIAYTFKGTAQHNIEKAFSQAFDEMAGLMDGTLFTNIYGAVETSIKEGVDTVEEVFEKVASIADGFSTETTVDSVTEFLNKVAKKLNLNVVGVKINNLARLAETTIYDYLHYVLGITEVNLQTLSANLILNGMSESFGLLLQKWLPMKNEIVDDYSMQDPGEGHELFLEAKALGEALDNYNAFYEKNGANLVDRTDYSKVKVSYAKEDDSIVVGPFTIDYVREYFTPPYMSDMMNLETGIISYMGIISAELYADDEKTVPIEDWEFVYPDYARTCRDANDWAYEYPYPNEVFYLRFPNTENYSINTLSQLEFQLEKMDADGQTYEVRGEYDQIMWMTTGGLIPCPSALCYCSNPVCFMIGPPGVKHVIPTPVGPVLCGIFTSCVLHSYPGWVQAMTNVNIYSGLVVAAGGAVGGTGGAIAGIGAVLGWRAAQLALDTASPPWVHTPFFTPHNIGTFYFCFPVPIFPGEHGMNLEEIIYSKIYVEYETISLELGEVQTYYNNNVNTTDVLYPVEQQGNLSAESSEVPVLPFLPNYPEYPGYPNYPDYEGNPNYPSDPYYFDNPLYEDYPSFPYYYGDATYPYYPQNRVIPLTFHISGTVWLDNPSGYESEANGILEEGERGIPNVEVTVYKVDNPDYIAKTLTDENGYYIFEYLRVGSDYYVEFAYDGVTYRTSNYLKSEYQEYNGEDVELINNLYKVAPEKYLDASYAIENVDERDAFNDKFEYISQNMATGVDGSQIPMEYKTWYTDNGAVSTAITTDSRGITLDDFKMYARTIETDLYYFLYDGNQVDYHNCDLYNDHTAFLQHTYPGLEHINLGLIKREQGDFTIKTDVYQIITTIKEDVQRYKYDGKTTAIDTYDILYRTGAYYTENPYRQEIDPDDHAYRIDSSYGDYAGDVSGILSLADEMNIYIEYKILIRNNATLQAGRVMVLENSFDEDQTYATEYDWTDLTSWIEIPMNDSEEVVREEITWHYREGTENGYTTIYTTGLADKDIQVGEVVELHLILKLNKDAHRNIILDNGGKYQFDGYDPKDQDINTDEFKEAVSEIHTYHFNEGLIDKSSHAGSIELGNSRTYSDGSDPAPLTKIFYQLDYDLGNIITGYVWEDLVNGFLQEKNEFASDGIRDEKEPLINDVKVELVEVVTDKQTGEEVEVLRKTASGTDYYRTGEDIKIGSRTVRVEEGQYLFPKLDTGIYRVKFTYGDTYQLTQDLTYNAQDYRPVTIDRTIEQYVQPDLEIMILLDTSEGMKTDDKNIRMSEAAQDLIDNLYEQVQTVKVAGMLFSEPKGESEMYMDLKQKPDKELLKQVFAQNSVNIGGTLADSINKTIEIFNEEADGKVIVILTDGYMENTEEDKEALKYAESLGIKVITVACSTDEWDKATFGTEQEPTVGILYNIRHLNINHYVSEVVAEDIFLEFEDILPNLTDAKDVETEGDFPEGSKVGGVYSRQRNIDYSSTLTNRKAEILDVDLVKTLKGDAKVKAISELGNNTQVTAITPNRNILISHDNNRTVEVNLGLVERAKTEIRIEEEVSRIIVTLSDGDVIIDTERDLSQNVQLIRNEIYSIYMDEEIMQGAKIDVEYKITITNNGQVDRLANYFNYDMFDAEAVAYMNRSVPIRIGTVNNYYSNLTFRAEDNVNLEVEANYVELSNVRLNGDTITNWTSFIEAGKTTTPTIANNGVQTKMRNDGRAVALQETITWVDRNLVDLNSKAANAIDNDTIKIVETDSLEKTELFPTTSKEVLNGIKETSISIFVNYSKTISANDKEDTLVYDNSSEIVRRISDVGRRDYVAVTGNYVANSTKIPEYDSAIAERIIILPPFGENHVLYYWIGAVSAITILGAVIFIRKKVI